MKIEIDGKPAFLLSTSSTEFSEARRQALRMLQLHAEVLGRLARHGTGDQRDRFAARAVGVGITPITRRLIHEFEENWFTELHPPLDSMLRLLKDRREALNSMHLGVPIAALFSALERLQALANEKGRPQPKGKGRPKGPQPPRKAAAIVWRLASDWKAVFEKQPSASSGSVFMRVCVLVLAAVDQVASEPQIRHAVSNWKDHESVHPYCEGADVDGVMAMRLVRLQREASAST